jgi:hypothetical protein
MDSLFHLFHIAVTYPALNLLVYFCQLTNNFGTAVLLFSTAIFVIIVLPWGLMDERMMRAELRASLYQPAVAALRGWLFFGMGLSRGVYWTFVILVQTLSLFYFYITIGTFFALAVLGASSLDEVNAVLYSFVPRLSSWPESHLVAFGLNIEVLKRGFPPGLLLIILLCAVPQTAMRTWLTHITGKPSMAFSILLRAFLANLAIALVLAFMFAPGAVLYLAVFTILYNLLIRSYSTAILHQYVASRNAHAAASTKAG